MSKQKPRYEHDCEDCIFIGCYKHYDFYYCPNSSLTTLLMRYGNEGPEYVSGVADVFPMLIFKDKGELESRHIAMIECVRQARASGLVKVEVVKDAFTC